MLRLVEAIDLGAEDAVLEIGCGPGNLTRELLREVRHLVGIELDERFVPGLQALAAVHKGFRVVVGDVLEADLTALLDPTLPWKCVANIPYYITTPILEKLLAVGRARFTDLYLLVQKEVAERIIAIGHREGGALSYFIQYHAVPSILLRVPRGAFHPPPEVDSALLHLRLREVPPVEAPPDILFRTIHVAFAQRRKMLRKSLGAGWSPPAVSNALEAAGIAGETRPEKLSLDQFSRLSLALQAAQDRM